MSGGKGEHRVFGIRHHGPGSARALVRALNAWGPDCVLVEGPPEADALVALAADPEMVPPVALLVYLKEAPGRAVFYPFTSFSPEWQALRWALAAGVPARFMDLPMTHQLEAPGASGEGPGDEQGALSLEEDEAAAAAETAAPAFHPFLAVARALGEVDPERWWEELVERRLDVRTDGRHTPDPTAGAAPAEGAAPDDELFPAIARLMTELRAAHEEAGGDPGADGVREARREAYMRRTIRDAIKQGARRVAVVCGAWHAPALASLKGATADTPRLRGLPKAKVAATWIPWTSARLAARSGYGAGVASPGWYRHVWEHPDDAATRYVIAAARLLRDEGVDTSSASVIDAVRLADALAALRERPAPGLAELADALRATICGGDDGPMRLVRDRLEVGREVGQVPASTPTVPLAADLARQKRSLRLKTSVDPVPLELDLRQPNGHGRSVLFRQLLLLDVPWARPEDIEGARGSFRERWVLAWRPELEVELITASSWGNTVRAAAAARLGARADAATSLGELAELLDAALLADLEAGVTRLLARVEEEAARASDVAHLMAAVPPLARIMRYGDVRGTPAERVARVARALFARALIGLPASCVGIDDDGAADTVERVVAFHAAVPLIDDEDAGEAAATSWRAVLARLAEEEEIHGLMRGVSTRLLLEQGALDGALGRLARRALSRAARPADASAWLEGLLRGSALVVLHQGELWQALDGWLDALAPEAFEEQLPLVRRAFASFSPAERRRMGERVAALAGSDTLQRSKPDKPDLNLDNARKTLAILQRIIGPTGAP
ncbi:MAG: hypothetical protein CVU56_26465 [Deltaproteobacteria bacterium HGW-Deltaproteobacteria-14]|jgi:hypothetical protein|nr:MAG: hypothetical protein CVU56_26465 [Deltaproteobacteria bacterium HGW-Deltaproteobacteria-14]